ncbi:MAG: hypothetical protein KatS3mg101_0186 [Patescibacteria group bacterium]|nr:MAG: hypothetical protein KatS3mg101_0186 [Patescibacteria group bacterium]
MSIELDFISVVIPIENIEKLTKMTLKDAMEYAGGFGRPLHDSYIYKVSRMSPHDIEIVVDFWKEQGLTPFKYVNGQKQWADLCVVDMLGGPTLPCDWLEYDPRTSIAWLKGTEKGPVVH